LRLNRAFSGLSLSVLVLGALPTIASAGLIDYRAVIIVEDTGGTSQGYLATDPNYWTPLLTPDVSSALVLDFTLNGTSGSAINLTIENPTQGFADLGLVVGRDSTSSDIASGSFNYLYIDPTDATAPGATPQSVSNYFANSSGLDKQGESAVWNIDATALTINPAWINTDGSMPTTEVFIQSNHVYAGGDSDAFHSRFPAPVTDATLHLDILSAVPEQVNAPEPASLSLMFGVFGIGMLWRARRSNSLL